MPDANDLNLEEWQGVLALIRRTLDASKYPFSAKCGRCGGRSPKLAAGSRGGDVVPFPLVWRTSGPTDTGLGGGLWQLERAIHEVDIPAASRAMPPPQPNLTHIRLRIP